MTTIDRRTMLVGSVAALTAPSVASAAQAAPPASLPPPDGDAVPVSATTAPLRAEMAELQYLMTQVTLFLDQIDGVEASDGSADIKSLFRYLYAFEAGSKGRLMAAWSFFVAEKVRELNASAIETEKQFGRSLKTNTRLHPDETTGEIAAIHILHGAGLSWRKAAALIFHEPPLAELVGRAMEARERQNGASRS